MGGKPVLQILTEMMLLALEMKETTRLEGTGNE